MSKATAGLILLGAAVVPGSLIVTNYAYMPVLEASGTIVALTETFSLSRGPICSVEIEGDGVGKAAVQDKQQCDNKIHLGQRVFFKYRQGRFVKSTLIWQGEKSIRPMNG